MTDKRFMIDKRAILDKPYAIRDNFELIDQEEVVELLNELHEENKELRKQLDSEHQMLENAILLERTRMGQNSLKQYKEAIQ